MNSTHNVRLPLVLLEKLDKLAESYGVTRGDVIRAYLRGPRPSRKACQQEKLPVGLAGASDETRKRVADANRKKI